MDRCIVLFSGGIDSTTALYWARGEYPEVFALTIDYGQRHRVEIEGSRKTAEKIGITQKIIAVDLTQIGGSALTDDEISIPEIRTEQQMEPGIPATYVPFRNGIFLSLAAAWGEVMQARRLICGFNIIDSPHYPDTTAAFSAAMEEAIHQGTTPSGDSFRFRIQTPFTELSKAEIIRRGLALGADYSHSVSCYSGSEVPCGVCSSCFLRQKAWDEVGRKDPLLLRLEKEGRI